MTDSPDQTKDLPLPMGCSTPGCNCKGPLVLCGVCHPAASTKSVLSNGIVLVTCSICERMITALRVTGIVPFEEAASCFALVEDSRAMADL